MTAPNPPAFPYAFRWPEADGSPEGFSPGMTLRDYFAATIDVPWNCVLDTLAIKYPDRKGAFTLDDAARFRAQMRYREADAMLAEREKAFR